jgi:hypothetical protein
MGGEPAKWPCTQGPSTFHDSATGDRSAPPERPDFKPLARLSFDFINLVEVLAERFNVEVPEQGCRELVTLYDCVAYISRSRSVRDRLALSRSVSTSWPVRPRARA